MLFHARQMINVTNVFPHQKVEVVLAMDSPSCDIEYAQRSLYFDDPV